MIKHVLADGRCLDTLEGYTVSYNWATETTYRLLVDILKGGGQREQQSLEKNPAATAQTAAAY